MPNYFGIAEKYKPYMDLPTALAKSNSTQDFFKKIQLNQLQNYVAEPVLKIN